MKTKELHQFSCKNGHSFYLDLNMPIPVNEFVDRTSNLVCPECKNDEIDIHFNTIKVVTE